MSSARELSTGMTSTAAGKTKFSPAVQDICRVHNSKKLEEFLKGCYCIYLDLPPVEA
jgi:hypothetical protein